MIKPKKSLGQNFLIDQNIINKIISLGQIENSNILEIGPGTGNLTSKILGKNPKSLILIEKDKNLYDELTNKYNENKKVSIFNYDILNFDLESKIKNNTIIFGNLPYNISTQILVKLIKFKSWPPKYKKLIFMFQKEVADKIIAKVNSKNYGRLTIMTKWRLKVTDHFEISNSCFFPKPKVISKVLVFKPIVNNDVKIYNISNLETITQIFFSSKRKMINKGLKKVFQDIKSLSKELQIDLSARPAELSENDYYKMTELFEKTLIKS